MTRKSSGYHFTFRCAKCFRKIWGVVRDGSVQQEDLVVAAICQFCTKVGHIKIFTRPAHPGERQCRASCCAAGRCILGTV